MTEPLLYTVLALVILVLATGLVQRNRRVSSSELDVRQDLAKCVFDTRSLDLAQRIFDSADYEWLRDGLCFPEAARALAKHRKNLAVKWLKELQNSIQELSRLPEPASAESREVSARQLPWLTLRLHFLVSYALLVVRLFGPYHQLVPQFAWLQSLRRLGFSRVRLGAVDAGRMP